MGNSQPKLTLDQTLEALRAAAAFRNETKIAFFRPYPKQRDFIALTKTKKEVMLMAANQFGKSDAGAYMTSVNMTGLYPKDWPGRKWNRPNRGWIAGESSNVVRDVQQKKLCGEPGVDSMFGTGLIPKDLFADKPSMSRGITDAYDKIQVKFIEPDGQWRGGVSVAGFKSYEQGRTKFQGETLDWGWADEEPSIEIYSEFLTRIQEGGVLYMTFTPLLGRSQVVLRFLDGQSVDRAYVNATIDDAEHFSAEEKKRRLEGYMEHERDARARGVPILGSGAVYQFPEDVIKEEGVRLDAVPQHWAKLWGLDFGIGHPFAAVLGAHDRDSDVIHVIHAIRQPDTMPLQHATAMRYVAANVPAAWPHDGTRRQMGSDTADQLSVIYRKHGVNMLHEHSTFEGGGYSTEAAVMEITERAHTGRFKVAAHLTDWFSEFRLYHRKEGVIVRQEDDLMSATEKLIMMKRFARPVPLGNKVIKRRTNQIADGVDIRDHWGI